MPATKKKTPKIIRKTSRIKLRGVEDFWVRLIVNSSSPGTKKPRMGRQKEPTREMRKESCLTRTVTRTEEEKNHGRRKYNRQTLPKTYLSTPVEKYG